MKMKRIIAYLLMATTSLGGDLTITTLDHKTYDKATVTGVENDGIRIVYDAGVVKIPFDNLPDGLRAKYGPAPASPVYIPSEPMPTPTVEPPTPSQNVSANELIDSSAYPQEVGSAITHYNWKLRELNPSEAKDTLERDKRTLDAYVNYLKEIDGDLLDRTVKAVAYNTHFFGMDHRAFRVSMGDPTHINYMTILGRHHDQWVYGEFPDCTFYYFDDGILTVQQN